MKNYMNLLGLMLPIFLFISSCGSDDEIKEPATEIYISPGSDAAEKAQLAFIEAMPGQTIIFEEGEFNFTSTLSMDGKSNIIIKGAGRDKTKLNFSEQSSGGEGMLISNTDSVRIEGLTIQDAQGDALKTRDCNKISFVDVGTVWSGEPNKDNGAYGLYPVLCTEVYIDNCYAYGASDAGIYVGQSDQVIVKNTVAEGNVAGIEIENTTNADVFNNEAFDNTGGILVFDLPGLTKYGSNVRVFENNCHDNNRLNFAPVGNIVGNVPAGTGIMILSTKNVEIFDNDITENTFAGVLVANYLLVNDSPEDPNYNPFPSGIYIHNNNHTMTGEVIYSGQPALVQQLIVVLTINGMDQAHIITDGLLANMDDLCIQESEDSFININASDPELKSVSSDVSLHNCSKTPLAEVSFTPF